MKLLQKDIDSSLPKKLRIYTQIIYSPDTFEKNSTMWFLTRKSIIRKNIGVTERLYSTAYQFLPIIRQAIYDYNCVKILDIYDKFKRYIRSKL